MDEPPPAGSSGKIDYVRRNRPPKRSTGSAAPTSKIDYTRRTPKAGAEQAPPDPPAEAQPTPQPDPGVGTIPPRVQAALPDAGAFLVEVLAELGSDQLAALHQELDRIRHPNGWIPNAALAGIRASDFRSGPLALLVPLVANNPVTVGVWAAHGLPDPERTEVKSTVKDIAAEQGVAAAASWAISRRPADRLDVDLLARLLQADFAHGASTIRNSQVVKAFRKWQR